MSTWAKWMDARGVYELSGHRRHTTGVVRLDDRIVALLRTSGLLQTTLHGLTVREETPMGAWLAAVDLIIADCSNEEAIAVLREGPAAFERFEALFVLARA